jgi:membrane protein involved in D-alanine export
VLPFASIDFFLLAGIFLLVAYACKLILPATAFRNVLLGITVLYITVFFPKPLHAFAFVVYCYLIYYLFEYVFRVPNKLYGSILLALPMILVKASVELNFIQFAGLSYITFRVIQVYLDNVNSEKPVNPFDYLLFLLFPATLLIGPIDRFQRFQKDLDGGLAQLNGRRFVQGWDMLLLGVFQKFIAAELVKRYWLDKLDPGSHDADQVFQNMYAYTIYLFFDFAGYSSMACGLGRLFGIDVPENFRMPFLAVNPQDFWRRWHITLGDWLRDYIFRPYYKWISGIRKFKTWPLFKQNSGLFLTFLVMGLWNGFHKNFILSGIIFGIYSVVHNSYVYQSRKKGRDIIFGNLPAPVVKFISIFTMFNLACFAIYIFSGRFPFFR